MLEDFGSGSVVFLLELVGALKEGRVLRDLVHLANEENLIVKPCVHRIVSKVEDCLRPDLRILIPEHRLDQELGHLINFALVKKVKDL